MRRLSGLTLTGLLSVVLVVLPATAPAFAADATTIVLAAEGGAGEEPPGPEPMGPNENPTKNPAAPTDYESNFLWGAAVGLLALTVFAILAVGGLYYLLVVRPRQRDESSA